MNSRLAFLVIPAAVLGFFLFSIAQGEEYVARDTMPGPREHAQELPAPGGLLVLIAGVLAIVGVRPRRRK
jgi:UDP-N-acetylmuramyl pentapeptide phosphotransferase/UDP-N-acetylglucosamine-1-phosphate transferase